MGVATLERWAIRPRNRRLEPKPVADGVDRIPLNDLARSWIVTSIDVHAAVVRVLAGGWYVHGPEHAAFETELAVYLDVGHAVAVANGTDALALAPMSVGCSAGSEVVTAANAGGYTSVAASLGCATVYADVGLTGW